MVRLNTITSTCPYPCSVLTGPLCKLLPTDFILTKATIANCMQSVGQVGQRCNSQIEAGWTSLRQFFIFLYISLKNISC